MIVYYTPPSGRISPVSVFIDNLPPKSKAKLINTIELIKQFATKVGLPHVRKIINTPLWEIRVLGQHNIRILFTYIDSNTILLLHGFTKKQQKTPIKEIRTALSRLKNC